MMNMTRKRYPNLPTPTLTYPCGCSVVLDPDVVATLTCPTHPPVKRIVIGEPLRYLIEQLPMGEDVIIVDNGVEYPAVVTTIVVYHESSSVTRIGFSDPVKPGEFFNRPRWTVDVLEVRQ